MTFSHTRLHPLVVAASVAVIIASVTASAVMTGVLPSNSSFVARMTAARPEAPALAITPDTETGVVRSSGASASGTTGSGGPGAPPDRDVPAARMAAMAEPMRDGLATPPSAPQVTPPETTGTGAGAPQAWTTEAAQPVRLRPSPGIVSEPGATVRADAAPALPAVFIHVYNAAGRRQMLQLEPRLRQHGMRLAGIKIVGTGPAQSDLRYFHASEKNEAQQVQTALLAVGLPVRKLKSITGYETRALPRQYEVWLSPGFAPER